MPNQMSVWEWESGVPWAKSLRQESITNRPICGVALGFEPRPQRRERVCAVPILLPKLDKSCFRKQACHIKANKLIAVSFPETKAFFFLRHLVRETRGSSHKDKRRGDLGKGMNRDLLARPYVSPNLASTRRQILSRWTELKSTKAKRVWNCWQEAHASLSRFGPS